MAENFCLGKPWPLPQHGEGQSVTIPRTFQSHEHGPPVTQRWRRTDVVLWCSHFRVPSQTSSVVACVLSETMTSNLFWGLGHATKRVRVRLTTTKDAKTTKRSKSVLFDESGTFVGDSILLCKRRFTFICKKSHNNNTEQTTCLRLKVAA